MYNLYVDEKKKKEEKEKKKLILKKQKLDEKHKCKTKNIIKFSRND